MNADAFIENVANDDKNKPKKTKRRKKKIPVFEDDENTLSDDEVMIINDLFVNQKIIDPNEGITIAPGENKRPVPSYQIDNLDELVFLKTSAGQIINENKRLNNSQLTKFQIRNVDGRHRTTQIVYCFCQKKC